MEKNISGVGQGIFLYLLALGEEGSEHDGARSTQMLPAEVSFGHGGLDGDRLAPGCIAADGEFLHRPDGKMNISRERWDRGWSRYSCAYLHSGIAAARAVTPDMSDIHLYPL